MTVEVSALVNWVFNDTARLTVKSLRWKQSQHSGQRSKARAASRSPEPHIHRHMPHPIRCSSVTMAPKFILAVPSGLVKPNHSRWTCPEEILGHGRGRGDIPAKPSVTATVVYFIKGFLWGFWISNCNLPGWKVAWKNNIRCIQGPERKFLCILEMVAIHWEMLMQLLCFLVSMPTCWACSQRRLVHSSGILVFGPEVSSAAQLSLCRALLAAHPGVCPAQSAAHTHLLLLCCLFTVCILDD